MSGNPTGSNVVPMPHAQAPATNPAQAPMPFPMWGGSGSLPWGPGCCPPGGMDALLKCYCDVQAATAFICSVMVQCVQTNPAVTAAIIAAIEASGSSLPTLGVTNGSNAQPGQVGEFVFFSQNVSFPTSSQIQQVVMGILQPGDWDCWATFGTIGGINGLGYQLNPQPPGVDTAMPGQLIVEVPTTIESAWVVSSPARASFAVPTLFNFSVSTNFIGAGPPGASGVFQMGARRAR